MLGIPEVLEVPEGQDLKDPPDSVLIIAIVIVIVIVNVTVLVDR